ncbi:TPA: hypothetical protein N0F65_000493 [Lagenidium giganteum]|uniref:Uncharacterized protein n=1 Tax=Lagenidium giganteum TaxID=4803 RepID=A0AAV2Z0F0_9STRA|nr:TPA: hypothetical protein N0F65_000493 [Lagenidium giganteum]
MEGRASSSVDGRVPARARRPRQRRMFTAVQRMQVTGSSVLPWSEVGSDAGWKRSGLRSRLQTVADLPPAFMAQLNEDDMREYERHVFYNGKKRSLAQIIRDVYDAVESVNQQDRAHLRRLMHEIVQRVLDPNGIHAPPDAGTQADELTAFVTAERERFLCLGGAECLLRVMHAIRQAEFAAAKGSTTVTPSTMHRGNIGDRNDVRSLWETPVYRPEDAVKNRQEAGTRKAILNDAMGILRELCYFSLNLAKQLCDKDGLIVYLFQLMEETKFFDNAAGLVEEILAVREESFDLSTIPRLHTIMQSFSSRQLAFFCRVLALVIFEPEDRRLLENSKVIKSLELLKLRRDRMMRADNIVDRNHAVVFNSPLILQRLLTVLQVQNFYFALNPVYEPFSTELATSAEFAMLLNQTNERSDWEPIERLLNHPNLSTNGNLSIFSHTRSSARGGANPMDNDHGHGHDHGHDHHHSHHHPFSLETAILRDLIFRSRTTDRRAREDVEAQVVMKSIVLAPYRVEVLFVLCTLLNGKRKIDFQDRLAEMGLVKTLNLMFDKFKWEQTNPSLSAPPHGPGCGCSLDASLKIQFLRLIHNFCDRDYKDNTSKLLLLSEHEMELLKRSDLGPVDINDPNRGLLCKIIKTLIEQPADSIFRFWLSSCVEAFLRRAAPEEQLFVARTPLLKAIIDEILNGGRYRSQGSFQSSFDLLGEMTKGNWRTLQLFHGLLDNSQFASFMEVVIKNLVDSNVFIRSMLLSLERFSKLPNVGTFGIAEDGEIDRMSEFLTVNIVRLLRDLMTIVTLDDVNHENICCLNTAIVILIFQNRRHRLGAILDALRVHEGSADQQGSICGNFRELLWFWIHYYTPRGRDRLSLEHSSDVKFEEWRHVVTLLCADDGSETALLPAPMRLPPSPYAQLYSITSALAQLTQFDCMMGLSLRPLTQAAQDPQSQADTNDDEKLRRTAFGAPVELPPDFVGPISPKPRDKCKDKKQHHPRGNGSSSSSSSGNSNGNGHHTPAPSDQKRRMVRRTPRTCEPRPKKEPVDFIYDVDVRRQLAQQMETDRIQLLKQANDKEARLRAAQLWLVEGKSK